MSERDDALAERMEDLLARRAAPADDEEATVLETQRRLDRLLSAHLSPSDPERAFRAVRATASSGRMRRIADGVARQRRARRRPATVLSWLPWSAAAALVLAAFAAWQLRSPAPRTAPPSIAEQPVQAAPVAPAQQPQPSAPETGPLRLESVSERLAMVRSDAAIAPAAGTALAEGDLLTTWSEGTVVAYADGTRLRLDAGTRLQVQTVAGAKQLRLETGGIVATVAHQPEGRPMTIATTRGSATVVGTVFTLGEDPLGTRLRVSEGRVRLAAQTAALDVAAGQQALLRDDAAPTLTTDADQARWTVRLSDECEDPSLWELAAMFNPTVLATERPASGSGCLRVEFHPHRRQRWGSTGRALTLEPRDRAIRFRLRVESADPGALIFVHLHDRDEGVWPMCSWPVAAADGWRTVTIPLPSRGESWPQAQVADRAWDNARMAQFFVGIGNAAGTYCVDRVEVLADPE